MIRSVAGYGLILGVCAFALQWLQFQHQTRLFSTQAYVVVIALVFAILGIWAGRRLTPSPKANPFRKNEAALKSLGVTVREYAVLELIAKGQSNKQIARSLGISPNTIKTHIANLFQKLDASRRIQAVQKARDLALIP